MVNIYLSGSSGLVVGDEDRLRDMALDLCLEQIDRSRPFFVGILGERYGYVPESFSEEAASNETP